jgi:hypothetical protein
MYMRKEVFIFTPVTKELIGQVNRLGATGIFVSHTNPGKANIPSARKAGLRVSIEVTLFAGRQWWEKFPSSRPIDASGKPIEPQNGYSGVCPNHPAIRQRQLATIRRLITSLPINGLWLDFIRYPGRWEVPDPIIPDACYCPNCLSFFTEETGMKLPTAVNAAIRIIKHSPRQWQDFREKRITDFVSAVKKMIKDSGQPIELGVFCLPDQERAGKVAQKLPDLSATADILSPMLYHAMCGRSTDWIASQIRSFSGLKRPILPIIQSEDKPRRLPAEEFRQSLKASVRSPSGGVVILFLEDLLKDRKKTETFRRFLSP